MLLNIAEVVFLFKEQYPMKLKIKTKSQFSEFIWVTQWKRIKLPKQKQQGLFSWEFFASLLRSSPQMQPLFSKVNFCAAFNNGLRRSCVYITFCNTVQHNVLKLWSVFIFSLFENKAVCTYSPALFFIVFISVQLLPPPPHLSYFSCSARAQQELCFTSLQS